MLSAAKKASSGDGMCATATSSNTNPSSAKEQQIPLLQPQPQQQQQLQEHAVQHSSSNMNSNIRSSKSVKNSSAKRLLASSGANKRPRTVVDKQQQHHDPRAQDAANAFDASQFIFLSPTLSSVAGISNPFAPRHVQDLALRGIYLDPVSPTPAIGFNHQAWAEILQAAAVANNPQAIAMNRGFEICPNDTVALLMSAQPMVMPTSQQQLMNQLPTFTIAGLDPIMLAAFRLPQGWELG